MTDTQKPWEKYGSQQTKKPWEQYGTAGAQKPWEQYGTGAPKEQGYKPSSLSFVEGAYDAAKGAVTGAWEQGSEAAKNNPLILTEEQSSEIAKLPNNRLLQSAAMLPYQAANTLGYIGDVGTKAIGGALGGGIAGATGADPAETRNLIGQGTRTVAGILESEMGRAPFGEVSPVKTSVKPWEQYGEKLTKVSERAEPAAESLSAAVAPKQIIPETPTKEWVRTQEDRLDRLDKASKADEAEFLNLVKALPAEMKNPETLEKMYRYGEGDVQVALSPAEKANYDKYVLPLKEEQARLYARVKGGDMDVADLNPDYMRRIAVGKGNAFDAYTDTARERDPIMGGSVFRTRADALKERKYRIVEDEAGGRTLVAKDGDKLHAVGDDGTLTPLKGFEGLENAKSGSYIVQGGKTDDLGTLLKKGNKLSDAIVHEGEMKTLGEVASKNIKNDIELTVDGQKMRLSDALKQGIEADAKVLVAGKPTTLEKVLNKFGDVSQKVITDGKLHTLKEAFTREIEAKTDVKYFKNAIANSIQNLKDLRAVDRSLTELKRLKGSPEYEAYTVPASMRDAPKGWREPQMPLFRGVKMDPKLVDAIDDFWGNRRDGGLVETLEKINRFATQTLFWSPIPHALNAGTHWFTARGWDWVTPKGYKSLALDGVRAIKEVVTQGPLYQDMLRNGAGLISSGIVTRELYPSIMKQMGYVLKQSPNKWDPIARILGVGPSALVKMLYEGSSRALWYASDAFLMQRVLELQRKGMSLEDAIAHAEKHIPPYKMFSRVLQNPLEKTFGKEWGSRASRIISQVLNNPILSVFSRYHYGMLKSYAHIAKDLYKGDFKGKGEAIGNLMATAVLQVMVWPQLNKLFQWATGDPETEMGPKGSLVPVEKVKNVLTGKESLTQAIMTFVTPAPITRMLVEAWPANREFFSGKNVRDPADEREGRWGNVAAQQFEHFAKNLISPYGTFTQMSKEDEKPWLPLVRQAFGLRKNNEDGRERAARYQEQESRRRQRKPGGPLEEWWYER